MNYWLMKSEEEDYSITDLQKDGSTPWVGVRNFQARNFMRDNMCVGDLVLFYHSNGNPSGIAGIGRVASASYRDKTQFDTKSKYYDRRATKEKPLWFLVDVSFVEKFKTIISIQELREHPTLKNMVTLRKGNRHSITPVTRNEYAIIVQLRSQ